MFSQTLRSGGDGVRRERESSNRVNISSSKNKAQGTIEYLDIIGVIVVVFLVVVGLLMSQMDSASGVGSFVSKLGQWSNSVAITETAVDFDGNYLVRLANLTGEEITISNVKIGDTNVDFSEDLYVGGAQNFVIPAEDACSTIGEKKAKQITITYYTKNGIKKTEVYPVNTFFDCTNYTVNLLASRCPSSSGAGTSDANAVASVVREGYDFYAASGTLTDGTLATRTISASSPSFLAGYYDVNNLATIDSDLVAANIKSGITVFGVLGTGLFSSCSGTAVDANVRSGVSYCNSGGLSTGSLATQYLSPSSSTVSAGYYDVNNLATIDSDLVAANIKSGTTVFGVLGTMSAGVYDGNATSAQVLSGYTFFSTSSTKQNGSLWIGSYLHSKQARCWNTANTEVACGSADGNTIYQDARKDGNVASFTTVGVPSGTVKDNYTGLIWQQAGTSTPMNWYNALGYCALLDLGGYPVGSWRLPSYAELATFPDMDCGAPSANCTSKYININFTQTGWDTVINGYWSSTTMPSEPIYAYFLHSFYGRISYNNKTNTSFYGVRCVRSGS
jgi:hypothetical protein